MILIILLTKPLKFKQLQSSKKNKKRIPQNRVFIHIDRILSFKQLIINHLNAIKSINSLWTTLAPPK